MQTLTEEQRAKLRAGGWTDMEMEAALILRELHKLSEYVNEARTHLVSDLGEETG